MSTEPERITEHKVWAKKNKRKQTFSMQLKKKWQIENKKTIVFILDMLYIYLNIKIVFTVFFFEKCGT